MTSELKQAIPEMKLEAYDLLNKLFNGFDPERHPKYFGCANSTYLVDGEQFNPITNGARTPNFIRDEFRWKSPVWIMYKGVNIALAQAKPHAMIKIVPVPEKKRYVRNMFISTLHSSFPKVKVLYGTMEDIPEDDDPDDEPWDD